MDLHIKLVLAGKEGFLKGELPSSCPDLLDIAPATSLLEDPESHDRGDCVQTERHAQQDTLHSPISPSRSAHHTCT